MSVIQFESVVENNMIRIPEEYVDTIHSGSKVMIISQDMREDFVIPTARAGTLSPDDFTELKIDTRNFKFDREEANERR